MSDYLISVCDMIPLTERKCSGKCKSSGQQRDTDCETVCETSTPAPTETQPEVTDNANPTQ